MGLNLFSVLLFGWEFVVVIVFIYACMSSFCNYFVLLLILIAITTALVRRGREHWLSGAIVWGRRGQAVTARIPE